MKEKGRTAIEIASLEITTKCNLQCVHCFAKGQSGGKELSLEEVLSVLDQLAEHRAEKGCVLFFGGGEPFTRKDFFTMVEHARRLNFLIIILTNGTLITEAIADKLAGLKIHEIRVALYGSSPEQYGRATRRPDLYNRVINSIKLLAERGVPISVVSHFFRHASLEDMLKIKLLVENYGARWKHPSWSFTPRKNGSLEPLRHILSESQYEMLAMQWPREYLLPGRLIPVKRRACPGAKTSFHLGPHGEIGNCLYVVSERNIRERAIFDLWRNDPLLKRHRNICIGELSACVKCTMRGYCHPCPGVNRILTGSFTDVDTEMCKAAFIKKAACNSIVKDENRFKACRLKLMSRTDC